MTDYASMAATALNRAVAERLGWRDFDSITYWVEGYDNTCEVEGIVATPPGQRGYELLPDYARDLNAALGLVADQVFKITYQPDMIDNKKLLWVEVWIDGHRQRYGSHYTENVDDLAAAICRAWLAATE